MLDGNPASDDSPTGGWKLALLLLAAPLWLPVFPVFVLLAWFISRFEASPAD